MRKIKVIHIITRLDKGGSSRILLDICRGIQGERFGIKIISGKTIDAQEDLVKFSQDNQIEVVFVNSLRREVNVFLDTLALFKLFRILKKESPDVLHLHTSKAGFLGRMAARLAAVPFVIYMPHGHIFYGYANTLLTKFYVFLERFAAQFCDYIVTLSDIERDEFLRRGIGSREKFITIHNGIDLGLYQPIDNDQLKELKKEINITTGTPVITVISRLEPVKGLGIFIEALAELAKVISQFRALIVGGGSLKESLQIKIRSLNLEEKIIFLGHRSDIKEIISLSDVIVNPALNEGLGLVILEAQALGKPVVATDVGGVPEVIIDGKTGILVESGNSKQIATAIIKILNDKELAARLAVEAKKRLVFEFSQEVMISRMRELYNISTFRK